VNDPSGSSCLPAPRLVESRASEIEMDGVLGRVLFPSPLQGPWLPMEELAESRMTVGGAGDPHTHESQEVVNYVLEGKVIHRDHLGASRELPTGSVARLSTRTARRHDLLAVPGTRTRWISLTARLPEDAADPTHPFDYATTEPLPTDRSGLVLVPVVGKGSGTASYCRLEASVLRFTSAEPTSVPVDAQRRTVTYVLDGAVTVNRVEVPAGAGLLTEGIEKLEFIPVPGSRAFLATIPIPRY
jgi:redox-sensitive bicupin YhaK (pirin superfamily)